MIYTEKKPGRKALLYAHSQIAYLYMWESPEELQRNLDKMMKAFRDCNPKPTRAEFDRVQFTHMLLTNFVFKLKYFSVPLE